MNNIEEAQLSIAYAWPDGTWCWEEDYDECFGYGSDKSDDYLRMGIPDQIMDMDEDAVDDYIHQYMQRWPA